MTTTAFKVPFFICFCHLMAFMPYNIHTYLTSAKYNTHTVARTPFVRIRLTQAADKIYEHGC